MFLFFLKFSSELRNSIPRGFTKRPNSGVTDFKQGTFAGLIEKIPYLVDLGITVVELLPVHQFDPQENNYWGYMTLNL
jgi:glycogen operon protein